MAHKHIIGYSLPKIVHIWTHV